MANVVQQGGQPEDHANVRDIALISPRVQNAYEPAKHTLRHSHCSDGMGKSGMDGSRENKMQERSLPDVPKALKYSGVNDCSFECSKKNVAVDRIADQS